MYLVITRLERLRGKERGMEENKRGEIRNEVIRENSAVINRKNIIKR